MNVLFGERLRRLRMEKGITQQGLADLLKVDRSSVGKWETGNRLPDAAMIALLSECLDADVAELVCASEKAEEKPYVLLLDDERIIMEGEARVLKEAIPNAEIYGFTEPTEAVNFVKENKTQIAFLGIELGNVSGLDVCRELRAVRPHINVFFLTAFAQYSLDAWDSGACGFLMKPLKAEQVKKQLPNLRWPVGGFL